MVQRPGQQMIFLSRLRFFNGWMRICIIKWERSTEPLNQYTLTLLLSISNYAMANKAPELIWKSLNT
jgi:hypothetical protein